MTILSQAPAESYASDVRGSDMKPEDFTKWREGMGLSKSAAAEALGVSRNMPAKYEAGEAEIPLTVALACTALARQLQPWPHAVRLSAKIQEAIGELYQAQGMVSRSGEREARAKIDQLLAQVDVLEDGHGSR